MKSVKNGRLLALVVAAGCLFASRGFAETVQRPGAELSKQILQRKDKALRQEGLDRAKAMLEGSAAEKKDALAALAAAHDVPFDRTPFTPLVRKCLSDADAEVRAAALWAIAAAGGDSSDLPAIAKMADDPSPAVRERVTGAIVFVSKNQPPADVMGPVVEKLLNDPEKAVRKEALRATWGVPVSVGAEKRMIELSKMPDSAYDAVYFGLSTRPNKSKAVCQRLVEVMQEDVSPDGGANGRAAWGLTYGVMPEASDLVAKAMISELDETLDDYVREQCVRALRGFKSDEARKKLEDLAANDESERIRQAARSALGRR